MARVTRKHRHAADTVIKFRSDFFFLSGFNNVLLDAQFYFSPLERYVAYALSVIKQVQ